MPDVAVARVLEGTTAITPVGFKEILSFPHSFETGEQGDVKLEVPFRCQVTKVGSIVTKALAITDAGTLQFKNNAGTNFTAGLLTHAASAALGNEQTASPTANNIFKSAEKITCTSAKTTAGGKVTLWIQIERLAD